MVASKTSFVIAAVALGAATSVYAAPVQYNGGADLAARGFEDEDFQLAARFFDDEFEFEARDFDDELEARDFDEEEYFFARASNANDGSVNGQSNPKDSSPANSASSSGSPAGLNGHRVFAANSGTGVPASKDGKYPHYHKHHHHHKNVQFGTPQHKSTGLTGSDSTHHPASGFGGGVQTPVKQTNSPAQSSIKQRDFDDELEARYFDEEEYLFARDSSANGDYPPSSTKLGGSVNGQSNPKDSSPTNSASSFGSPAGLNGHRVFAANSGTGGPASKDGKYPHYHKHHHHHKNVQSGTPQHKSTGLTGSDSTHRPASGFGGGVQTPVKQTNSPAQNSIKQRDFDEEDAILLARSLGLDDDYFLEARSFDDDMYYY